MDMSETQRTFYWTHSILHCSRRLHLYMNFTLLIWRLLSCQQTPFQALNKIYNQRKLQKHDLETRNFHFHIHELLLPFSWNSSDLLPPGCWHLQSVTTTARLAFVDVVLQPAVRMLSSHRQAGCRWCCSPISGQTAAATASAPSAIVLGMPPHWANEPHQKLAQKQCWRSLALPFLPLHPPRAPPLWDLFASFIGLRLPTYCISSSLRQYLPSPSSCLSRMARNNKIFWPSSSDSLYVPDSFMMYLTFSLLLWWLTEVAHKTDLSSSCRAWLSTSTIRISASLSKVVILYKEQSAHAWSWSRAVSLR